MRCTVLALAIGHAAALLHLAPLRPPLRAVGRGHCGRGRALFAADEDPEARAAAPPAEKTTTSRLEGVQADVLASLVSATRSRDKGALQSALGEAKEVGFTGKEPEALAARKALQELSQLSDGMRAKLIAEANSQGGSADVNWNPGFAFGGIFALVAVLVVVGGKGIFY